MRRDLCDSFIDGAACAVRTIVGDRVEGIGDSDDRRRLWYRRAGDATRVAAAVPVLVVVECDAGRKLEAGVTFEEVRASDGVLLHDLPLARFQLRGAGENGIRHANLADVVQHGGQAQRDHVCFRVVEFARQRFRQVTHAL